MGGRTMGENDTTATRTDVSGDTTEEILANFTSAGRRRRRFWALAVMIIAAAELVMIGSANAQFSKINQADATTIKPATNTSFGSLKQIDAGVPNVGYAHCRHIQLYGRHPS
jgi:hypothetical protein